MWGWLYRESNSGPRAYETRAPPLSYTAEARNSEWFLRLLFEKRTLLFVLRGLLDFLH